MRRSHTPDAACSDLSAGGHVPECSFALPDAVSLSVPISAEAPCGPDLEYDDAFLETERALAGVPERQMGRHVIPAHGPDWVSAYQLATDLLARSRDLRVAVALTRALTWNHGLVGTAVGLRVIDLLLDKHWGAVHPQLDPGDGNDPIARINALASLSSAEGLLGDLRGLYLTARPSLPAQAARALRSLRSIEQTLVARLGDAAWPTHDLRALRLFLHALTSTTVAVRETRSEEAAIPGEADANAAQVESDLLEAICAWIDHAGIDPGEECRRAHRLTTRSFLDIGAAVAPQHAQGAAEFMQRPR